MAVYKHIIFDLDSTLWDFEVNCAETLKELFDAYGLGKYKSFTEEDFITTYKRINENMWKEYHSGIIDKLTIRSRRFEKTFEQLGIDGSGIQAAINEDFLKRCPAKGGLLPFAREVLQYLQPKYSLHILTNGFKESQHIKIGSAGIGSFFKEVINSESCGFLKPDKKIFEHAISKIDSCKEECIMIGDDLEADVLGARNAGIDHIFLNRQGKKHDVKPTHEIKCLSELFSIL